MSIRLVTDKENVDYQAVADILDHFGLSHFDAATEEKIFKNSYATAFIYDGGQVVGCARAIARNPSPIQWVPDAHAVTTLVHFPLNPS